MSVFDQILPTRGEVADAQRLTEGALLRTQACVEPPAPSTTLRAVPLPTSGEEL